jgi:hypothetical protein
MTKPVRYDPLGQPSARSNPNGAKTLQPALTYVTADLHAGMPIGDLDYRTISQLAWQQSKARRRPHRTHQAIEHKRMRMGREVLRILV